MSLKEHIYSILIVSSADNFTSALTELLSEAKYSPIHIVKNVSHAKRALAEKSYDFVIINSPLPDDAGIRLAIDVSSESRTAVLLFAKTDIYAEIHSKTADYGVFTLSKPTSRVILLHALDWLESARERLRLFEKKTTSIEDKMTEIRIVNKAKWLLISELNMSEPDAHRYIEKTAMDRSLSKKAVAEEIIRTYS
ncbi:MAG: ANTAR domain-containing protein [Acetatifactor sp.]|nr:ANTAR domain-containing protein [Acetatifactor sp.]